MQKQYSLFGLIIGRILLRKRWLAFVIVFSTVFIVEMIEYWPTMNFNKTFLYELFFFGLVIPLIMWGFLAILNQVILIGDGLPLEQVQAEAIRAEQQRIARDLHDRLAQNLSYLHFRLDQLATQGGAVKADLEQMREVANNACKDVRGAVRELRDQYKTSDDLFATLRREAQDITTRTGLNVKLDYQKDMKPLCPMIGRAIVEVTHEALNNVNKHAEAVQVIISLTYSRADLFLTIVDDGKGFRVGDKKDNGHYGLDIMHERIQEIGGILNINSIPNRGTELTIQIPDAIDNSFLNN